MQIKVRVQVVKMLDHEQFGRGIYIKDYFARLISTLLLS